MSRKPVFIAIGVLLALVAAPALYFSQQILKRAERQELANCSGVGERLELEWEARLERKPAEVDRRVLINKQLNTCLFYHKSFGQNRLSREVIYDVYARKILAECIYDLQDRRCNSFSILEDFTAEKKRLLGE